MPDFDTTDPMSFVKKSEGTRFVEGRHILIESSMWLHSILETLPNSCEFKKDIFLFANRATGTFSVAIWTIPEKIMTVLETFDGHPDHDPDSGGATNLPDKEYMALRFQPAGEHARRVLTQMKAAMKEFSDANQEGSEEKRDLTKHLKRQKPRWKRELGGALQGGQVPFATEREMKAEL